MITRTRITTTITTTTTTIARMVRAITTRMRITSTAT